MEPNFPRAFSVAGIVVNSITLAINLKSQFEQEQSYSPVSAIFTLAYVFALYPFFFCNIFLDQDTCKYPHSVFKYTVILSFVSMSIFAWISFGFHCHYQGCFVYETAIYVFILTYLAVFMLFSPFMLVIIICLIGEYLCRCRNII